MFCKKEFECTKCKATFKIFFQHFWLFMPFWWEWKFALYRINGPTYLINTYEHGAVSIFFSCTNLRWVPLRRFFRLNTRHSSSLLYQLVFQIVCVRTFLGILVRRNPWTDPCYQLGPEIRRQPICLFGNSNKLSVLFCDLPNICCCKTAWCWNRIAHNTCLE